METERFLPFSCPSKALRKKVSELLPNMVMPSKLVPAGLEQGAGIRRFFLDSGSSLE
jgi:hypothetical protein